MPRKKKSKIHQLFTNKETDLNKTTQIKKLKQKIIIYMKAKKSNKIEEEK